MKRFVYFVMITLISVTAFSCAFFNGSADRDSLADKKLGLNQEEEALQIQDTLTDLKEDRFEDHNQRLQREITDPLVQTDLSGS